MKRGIRKESVAIVLARLTNEKVAINNGDISSLISSIEAISKQMFDLNNALFEANDNIAALEESIALIDSNIDILNNRFDGHTHSYSDIDNLAITINKTTSTPPQ